MAGMGLNTALLGLFSSDRKAAKQRELGIAQAMYNKEQKELQQQYQMSSTMAKMQAEANAMAGEIVYQKTAAKKLAGTLNNTFAELTKGANKYGGNVMKYMVAEGNDLLYGGIADFKSQLNDMKQNEAQVAKFIEATQSKENAPLVMMKDYQQFEDFNNEKTNKFVFSGLLSSIDDGYIEETTQGVEVTAADVLGYGQNRRAIKMNLMRERNLKEEEVTTERLLQYTQEKYLGSELPVTGTKKYDTSYGNELNTINKLAQQLKSQPGNMFSTPFTTVTDNMSDQFMQFGVDMNTRASVKNNKRINTSYRVFTDPELEDAMLLSVFNNTSTGVYNSVKPGLVVGADGIAVDYRTVSGTTKERQTKRDLKRKAVNNIFNFSTEGNFDENGSLIKPEDTYWELFGGESKRVDAKFNGFFYGERITYVDANTGEVSQALITENMDADKAEELRANFGEIQNKETVLLAELQEDDTFRNDFYYKVIDVNDSLQASINKYTKDKDLSAVANQNASSEKMIASKKFKQEQIQNSINVVSNYTGNDINQAKQLAADVQTDLFGAFNQFGLQANMLGNVMAFNMLNIPDNTQGARDIFTNSMANLPTLLSQKGELSDAIKGGPNTFNSYLRKNIFQSADQYQEYLDLSSGWNTFFKHNR